MSFGKQFALSFGLFPGQDFRVPLIYDLPLEQLCAQLTIATESALERPGKFLDLLLCLSGSEQVSQIDKLRHLSEDTHNQAIGGERFESVEADRIRGVLMRVIQRRVDAFQIETGGRWRRGIQSIAATMSLVFSILITLASIPRSATTLEKLSYVIYAALAGILAAFLSMFLRDLTAVVESKRRQK